MQFMLHLRKALAIVQHRRLTRGLRHRSSLTLGAVAPIQAPLRFRRGAVGEKGTRDHPWLPPQL